MTNLNIHKFSVDQASGNVESVTFVRDDGTLQTLNNENQTISASFTENGTYIPPTGFTGFDSVEIDVPPSGKLETITVELDSDAQTIRPSVGFDGIGEVRVPKSNLQSLSVQLTPNQQTIVAADDNKFGYSEVTIPGYSSLFAACSTQDLEDAGVGLGLTQTVTPDRIYGPDTTIKGFTSFQIPPAILQAKEIELSTSEQTIRPTDGAYGLSEVIVPSVYGVFTDEVTITENGDDITPPSPYLGFGKVNVRVPVPTVQNETVISAQITQNGTHSYIPSTGYDATKKVTVTVNVPVPRVQSSKNVGTITENGAFTIDPDSGYDVMGEVTGTVAVPLPTLEPLKTVTANVNNDTVTITPDTGYDAIQEVKVNVQVPATGNVQASKNVSYTQSGTYTIRADAGYDSLEQANVTVNVPIVQPTYYQWGIYWDYMSPYEILLFNDDLTTKTDLSSLRVGDNIKAFSMFSDSGGNRYVSYGVTGSDLGIIVDYEATSLHVESIDEYGDATVTSDGFIYSGTWTIDTTQTPTGPYTLSYFQSLQHGTGT